MPEWFQRDVLADRIYPESHCGLRNPQLTWSLYFNSRINVVNNRCQLYIAFSDLSKAFDFIRRKGLFQWLMNIGCPPQLPSIITSLHENMQGVVSYGGWNFNALHDSEYRKTRMQFSIGIFSMLLSSAFRQSKEGVYLHTRSESKLFNLANVCTVLIRELVFNDDAALTMHTEQLMSQFHHSCKEFGLTINVKHKRHRSRCFCISINQNWWRGARSHGTSGLYHHQQPIA